MITVELFGGFTYAQINHQTLTPVIRDSLTDMNLRLSGPKIVVAAELGGSFFAGYYVEMIGSFAYAGPSISGTLNEVIGYAPDGSMVYRVAGLSVPPMDYILSMAGAAPSNPRVTAFLESRGYVPDGGPVAGPEPTDGPDDLDGTDDAELFDLLAGNDTLFAGGGDDTVFGGAGDDLLLLGEGDNVGRGQGGNDIVSGGSGADKLIGGGGNDSLVTGAGDDRASGGGGTDTLFGQRGADTLKGGGGDDRLYGDEITNTLSADYAGADVLIGGRGNDVLSGGLGPDRFVFRNDRGIDRIVDFEPGIDTIEIKGRRFESVDDLRIDAEGGGARIAFGKTAIVVENVAAAEIADTDFLF